MAVITRKVAVMMPFGGSDKTLQRSCMLNFLRLKYIIEEKIKSTVTSKDDNSLKDEIKYDVKGFYVTVGGITDPAVKTIRGADILIGLITEKNVNVIYELAVRSLLVDSPILVVKGDPDDMLPLYLKGLSSIDYDKHTPIQVQDEIRNQSSYPSAAPLALQSQIPPTLRGAIDQYDVSLNDELQRALLAMECPPMEGPRGPVFKELLDEVLK